MGCWIGGTPVPKFWMKPSEMRFLLVCFLIVLSDAAPLMDFPGSTICLDSEIQIKKPKDVDLSTWQSLHIVDSLGLEVDACEILHDGSLLTIPERCIHHETGRRVAHISFNDSTENKTIYQISCDGEQADSEYMGPTIQCTQDYMTATISRTLSAFGDEVLSTPPPASAWTIGIDNGTLVKVNMRTARRLGYTLTSDVDSLMIRVNFNAFGIKEYTSQDQKFYRGDITLIQERRNPKITIDVKLMCHRGPPACSVTQMTLAIPRSAGVLQYIYIGNQEVPLTTFALQQQGMTLSTIDGVQLSIALNKLQEETRLGQKLYSLPSLTLTFIIDEMSIPMTLSPECLISIGPTSSSPAMAKCTSDGFMQIEVLAMFTKPSLDLNTVTLRDRTCQPQDITSDKIVFRIPLTSCGTTKQYIGGRIFYENEVSALWKDLPPRSISRDSELRETIWCFFDGSGLETINVNVITLPPPVSSREDGPLLLVMNIYPDISYQMPYSDDQYPVVKILRDPIFLEVQVLNRNDPNIELVLDDCWATMSEDPKALPQWNVVVDGCQEAKDNYLTVFHPVVNVPQATYRKQFEVKAFAFMQGGELSSNLVYFHCSAIICNIRSPDYPLCTKSCLPSRSRRDELFLHRHSNLASLPGPILLLDAEPSLILEDEQDVIKQVTIGVLPAFALVAVIVLVAALIYLKRKSKS